MNNTLCEKAENFTYQHFLKKSSGLQGGTIPFVRQGSGEEGTSGMIQMAKGGEVAKVRACTNQEGPSRRESAVQWSEDPPAE